MRFDIYYTVIDLLRIICLLKTTCNLVGHDLCFESINIIKPVNHRQCAQINVVICTFTEHVSTKTRNNNWFMLKRAPWSYDARGKFGDHERSLRVPRGDSRQQFYLFEFHMQTCTYQHHGKTNKTSFRG